MVSENLQGRNLIENLKSLIMFGMMGLVYFFLIFAMIVPGSIDLGQVVLYMIIGTVVAEILINSLDNKLRADVVLEFGNQDVHKTWVDVKRNAITKLKLMPLDYIEYEKLPDKEREIVDRFIEEYQKTLADYEEEKGRDMIFTGGE